VATRFTFLSEVPGLVLLVLHDAESISKALGFLMQKKYVRAACDFVHGKGMLLGCGMAACGLQKKMVDIFLKNKTSYVMEIRLCE
jgi:hypothetical protein